MDKEEKITFRFDKNFLSHKFFDFLSKEDKRLIEYEYQFGKSFITVALKNNEPIFGIVYRVNAQSIEAREVGGNFLRYPKQLEMFGNVLAKLFKKKYLILNASRAAVARAAEKMGYKKIDGNFFEKVASYGQ